MSKQLVRPTYDRVLVRRLAAVTAQGDIIIPDAAQERPAEGHIVALGPSVTTSRIHALRVAHAAADSEKDASFYIGPAYPEQLFDLGDQVMFGKYAGVEVRVNDEAFVLLKMDEIQATVITIVDAELVDPDPEPDPMSPKDGAQ